MSISKDNPIKKTALFLALINVLAFLVYYTVFYVWKNQPTLYVFYYFTEIVNILLPILAATALFISYAKHGVNKSLLYSLYFSLTWILHLFPYYAYEYAYQRLDFEAVLAFAALHTVFMIIVVYIEITVLFLLMIFVTEKIAKKKYGSFNKEIIFERTRFGDFDNPVSVGLLSASLAMFVYNLSSEIIDTVSFIRDVWGYYETGEIIYIVFRYFFILAMLFVSHLAANYAKKKLLNH